jgi:trigger factor
VAGTEIQRLEHSAVKLTITLTKDEAKSEYDKHLKELLKTAQLPGFRRGKVPSEVLEHKIGPALKEDILNQIISDKLGECFKEEKIPKEDMPLEYSEPAIDGEPKPDFENDISFSVSYDVMPKVSLNKWEGFELELDDAQITDEDINNELEKIRDRNAIVMDRDDDAVAQKGDIVTVDYSELDENGESISGTKREDFVFTLGSGQNHFKFDDEIIGLKKNESRDFEKHFPQDFEDKELAATTKKLRVTIKAIKEKKLPDLDDDLAQDVGEQFKTLADLKKDLTEKLETRLADALKIRKQDAIINKIIEANPIDLPESMIKAEIFNAMQRVMGHYGLTDKYIQRLFGEDSEVEKLWRPKIENQLKTGLIIRELIKLQNIELTDAEKEQEIQDYVSRSGKSIEEVRKAIENNELNLFDDFAKEKKVFALLESKNIIKKGKKVKYLDLLPENA